MRLLIKHLLRDILRSLPRTLLLLLTLSLSTAVAVSAIGTYSMFQDHVKRTTSPYASLGDIIVSTAGNDENLIFERKTAEQVGERGDVLGEFGFSAFLEDETERIVSVSATDLQKADAFYQFKYYEYGKFTTENLKNSAIISAPFANELSLSVGDSIVLSALGVERTFTVEAIAAPEGLLETSDMIVSISGIKQIIANELPVIAALGDRVMPYTRLIIRLDDPSLAADIADELSDELPQYNIVLASNDIAAIFSLSVELGAIFLLSLIIILLASTLTLSSMSLLNRKRRREYSLFVLSGATQRHVTCLRLAEGAIYALFSAICGIALASVFLPKISSLFAWQAEQLSLGVNELIFGLLFAPTLVISCTAISIHCQKKGFKKDELSSAKENDSPSRHTDPRKLIVSATVTLVLIISTLLVPTAYRFIPAVGSILFVLCTIYLLIPPALHAVCGKIANSRTKAKGSRGSGVLTLRQLQNVYALKQVCRLATLLIALFAAITFCRGALNGAATLMRMTIQAEYAIINLDQRAEQKLKELSYVDGIARIGAYRITELNYGYTLSAFSATGDTDLCIGSSMIPDILPQGTGVVISRGVADICSLSIGDEFPAMINGIEHTLTVISIYDNNINSVYIDASALGLDYDISAVKLNSEAESYNNIKKELSQELEPFGASMVSPTTIFGTKLDTAEGFSLLSEYTVNICALLITLGLCDTLLAHYRERRREYNALLFAGMSRKSLLFSKVREITIILFFALLCALPTSIIISWLLELAAGSFGFSILGLLAI